MRLLTPRGMAGVAVVSFDADERQSVLAMLRFRTADGLAAAGHRPVRGDLWIEGEQLDDALVVDRGEAGLELHLHGAPAIWSRLSLAASLRAGGDSPAPEPWMTVLRTAMSSEAVALACEQSELDFTAALAAVGSMPDDSARAELMQWLRRTSIAEAMIHPTRLVLVGRQNVGKSTLFNRLLHRERSLVGPEPGLTRDAVQELVVLGGYLYELVDTAGDGVANATVDLDAIDRGHRLRRDALVALVVPAGEPLAPEDRALVVGGAILVRSKSDLAIAVAGDCREGDLRIAARSATPASVRRAFGEALRNHRRLPPAGRLGGPAALDARQRASLRTCARKLQLQADCGDGEGSA